MDSPRPNLQIALDFRARRDDMEAREAMTLRQGLVPAEVAFVDFFRPKAPSLQIRRRLLASVPWARAAWLILWRMKVPKDIRDLILWNYLGGGVFHCETETLRQEKIWAPNLLTLSVRKKRARTRMLKCLRMVTRFLLLEIGNLTPVRVKGTFHSHYVPEQLSPCLHSDYWVRLGGLVLRAATDAK